jgi:hypothetical protein
MSTARHIDGAASLRGKAANLCRFVVGKCPPTEAGRFPKWQFGVARNLLCRKKWPAVEPKSVDISANSLSAMESLA